MISCPLFLFYEYLKQIQVTKKRRNSKKSSQSELILDIIPSKESRMTKCQISSKQQLLLKCLQTKEYYFSQNIFIYFFIYFLLLLLCFLLIQILIASLEENQKRKKKKKQKRVTLVFLNQTSPTNPVEI